jgi:hypothetical protein
VLDREGRGHHSDEVLLHRGEVRCGREEKHRSSVTRALSIHVSKAATPGAPRPRRRSAAPTRRIVGAMAQTGESRQA